jgi:hypothetical protein
MRSKPRNIVFPAMRFVKKTHKANISKLRLKHILLLLMRIAAILLLVGLIARAQFPRWKVRTGVSSPTAAVIIMDNSGSMSYVHDKQPLLVTAKQFADSIIKALPEGSQFAVLQSSRAHGASPRAERGFADLTLAEHRIADVQQGAGDDSLADAISQAVTTLAGYERFQRKEVYIFTDMTQQAWRDVRAVKDAGASAGMKDCRFVVVNCAPAESMNVSVGQLSLKPAAPLVGSDVTIETPVSGWHVGGEMTLQSELDGAVQDECALKVPPDGAVTGKLKIRPARQGVIQGKVKLTRGDALDLDDTRYFTLIAAPPTQVLIVRDGAIGHNDDTSDLVANAISPAGGDSARWPAQRTMVTSDRLDAQTLSQYSIVVLTNVSSLTDAQWQRLEEYVRLGNHLWVVGGSLMSADSYDSAPAQRLMPVAIKAMEELPKAQSWKIADDGDPLVAPLVKWGQLPVSDARCKRRFTIDSTASDASVPLAYTDGVPAAARRIIGDGSVLFWNFSPDRDYSNLAGLDLFPFLTRIAIEVMTHQSQPQTQCNWGQIVSFPIPKTMKTPTASLRRPDSPSDEPLTLDLLSRTVNIDADKLGNWMLTFTEGPQKVQFGFSVNAPVDESDLAPITADKLKTLFPQGKCTMATGAAEVAQNATTTVEPLDLAPLLLIAILAIMVGESFFSNRFYKQASNTTNDRQGDRVAAGKAAK